MLTLGPNTILGGVAGAASSISATVMGGTQTGTTKSFPVLYQGYLANSATALYTTAPGETQMVAEVALTNVTASPVSGVQLYVGGTASVNKFGPLLTIPANGSVQFANGQVQVVDGTGAIVSSVAIADGAVTNAKLAAMAADTVKGNAIGSPATPQDIALGADGMSALQAIATHVRRSQLALHTGVLGGCVMSINGSDGTKLDVSAGSTLYVDDSDPGNPVVETLTFAGASVVPAVGGQGLDTLYKVWVGVERQSAGVGVLRFSNLFFSDTDRRRVTVLGTTWATAIGSNTIAAVSNYQTPAWGAAKTMEDLAYALGGSINIDGNDFSAHSGQLTLDKSAGHAFRLFGAASVSRDAPNNPTSSGAAPCTSYRYWAAAGTSYGNALSSEIDPDYYDNGGTRTAVPAGKWTIQRVYWFPSTAPTPILAVTYGQAYFDTLDAAKAAANSQVLVFSDLASNALFGGLLRARVYVQQGSTDLSGAYVERMSALVGGGASGGSGSVTDHATLAHLDYASSGHTGFMPSSGAILHTPFGTPTATVSGVLTLPANIATIKATGTEDFTGMSPGSLQPGDSFTLRLASARTVKHLASPAAPAVPFSFGNVAEDFTALTGGAILTLQLGESGARWDVLAVIQ